MKKRMFKRVDMISEKHFDELVPDICDSARASLWEMWRDDLSAMMGKAELIRNANALLIYFESKVLVSDVGWDELNSCFEWELELPG